MDFSEERARAEIGRMIPGTYTAEATWDLPPGAGPDQLVCRLTATVSDGRVVLDFSDSDGQVDRYYNGVHGTSYAGRHIHIPDESSTRTSPTTAASSAASRWC